MIYNILVEQEGSFVTTGETAECTFEQTIEVIASLQVERGGCYALSEVTE